MKRIITLVLTLAALLVLTVTACADTIPGTAKLTITPTDTKVSGDTATVTYSVTVTPPEGKELGVFSVQLQPSDGMTLPRKFTVDGKKVITYGDGKLEYDEVEKTGYFATYEYTPQTGTKTVQSGKTFDAGVGVYVGLSILSLTGSAVVIGKKRKTR